MDIAGDYTFDAPQSLVWESLLDPNVLGSIMPGGKGFEKVGENQYKGVLEVKVGPVQGLFQGEINLSDITAPVSYQMQVDGKGAPGFVKATGNIHLETRGSQTFMDYSGQANVGGRIASVGQRLMDSAARSIIRQSLDALNEYLKVQAAQQPPPPAPAQTASANATAVASPVQETTATSTGTFKKVTTSGEFKRPSQTGLAVTVAKDVLSDFIPAKYWPWVIAAIVVIVLVVILAARR